jgi:hypothetical protein
MKELIAHPNLVFASFLPCSRRAHAFFASLCSVFKEHPSFDGLYILTRGKIVVKLFDEHFLRHGNASKIRALGLFHPASFKQVP